MRSAWATRFFWLLLLVIAGAGAGFRSLSANRPFGGERGQEAFYSVIAINHLRYGLSGTGFANVVNPLPVTKPEFIYYTRHPSLVPILVAGSFAVFSPSEWSARLVPIIFSVMTILLMGVIGRRVLGARAGLLTAFLVTLVPAGASYGSYLDIVGPVCVGLCVLAVYWELRRLESPRLTWWFLCFIATALSMLADWPGAVLAFFLVVNQLLFKRTSQRLSTLVLGAAAGGLGLLVIGYSVMLAGKHAYEGNFLGILGALRQHSIIGSFEGWQDARVDILFPRFAAHLLKLYTLPILLLSVVGWWFINRRVRRQPSPDLDTAGGLLLGAPLVFIAFFPEGAFIHDYWFMLLLPGIALLAAASLEELFRRGRVAVWAGGAITAVLGVYLTWTSYRDLPIDTPHYKILGEVMRKHTPVDQVALTCEVENYALHYYSQRRVFGRVADPMIAGLPQLVRSRERCTFVVPLRPFGPYCLHQKTLEFLQGHYAYVDENTPIGPMRVFCGPIEKEGG